MNSHIDGKISSSQLWPYKVLYIHQYPVISLTWTFNLGEPNAEVWRTWGNKVVTRGDVTIRACTIPADTLIHLCMYRKNSCNVYDYPIQTLHQMRKIGFIKTELFFNPEISLGPNNHVFKHLMPNSQRAIMSFPLFFFVAAQSERLNGHLLENRQNVVVKY